MNRFAAVLALLAIPLLVAARQTPKPQPPTVPQPADLTNRGDLQGAAAALDKQDTLASQYGPLPPPAVVPIKETNYPVPFTGAVFVAPDGKADAPGTKPNEPTTIANALQTVPDGGTVVFRAGTYRLSQKYNLPRRVTLQPYPEETVWIKGSVVLEGWQTDGDGVWRKNDWAYKFPPAPRVGSEYLDPKFPLAAERDMVFVDGQALTQVATRDEVKPGTFFVDGANRALYIGTNPTSKTVEAAIIPLGFDAQKTDSANPAGSVVRGLGFAHFGDQGFQARVNNLVFENNTFAWCGQRGFSLFDAKNTIVKGNTFSCNGRVGMRAARTPKLRVEGNTFAHNNVERFRTAWDAAGIKVTETYGTPDEGLVFTGNIAEHNYATAVWLDIDANHAAVTRNHVRRNGGIGLFFEISQYAVIAFNVAEYNGTGVMISNSKFADVYNNTLFRNGTNVVVKQTGRKNNYKNPIAGTAPSELFLTQGNVVRNNILAEARPGSPNPLFDAVAKGKQKSAFMVTADNNIYVRGKNEATPLVRWSLDGQAQMDYASLADFTRSTEQEKSAALTGIIADTQTLFADAGRGDFHLRAGSSLAGLGVPLPENIARAAGLPTGAKVPPGAFGAAPSIAAKSAARPKP